MKQSDQARLEENEPQVTYDALAAAGPAEKAAIALKWAEGNAEGRLELPSGEAGWARLDGADFGREALAARRAEAPGPVPWWDDAAKVACLRRADLRGAGLTKTNLRGADLRGADLRGAVLIEAALGDAKLRRAKLEEADLRRADFAGADLTRADLGRADLRGAMMEEAKLGGATLRFADLRDAVLEQADLRRADLWSINGEGVLLARANLRHANLREAVLRQADLARADLRGAALLKADLRGASLVAADLRGAEVDGADLTGAVLRDARLEDLDLSRCKIDQIHMSRIYLDRTRLRLEQIGGAIGEELVGDYELAALGYQALERNFADLGDPDAASWAYRRRRRMQKHQALRESRAALAESRTLLAAKLLARYVTDQVVEWLCDYGDSVPRVLGTMVAVYLAFAILYGATGSVVRVTPAPGGPVKVTTRAPTAMAVFSFLAMTNSANSAFGLEPRSDTVNLISGLQSSLGVALTGLLGFVLGNRIRR